MSTSSRDRFCAPGVSMLVDSAITKPKIPRHLAAAAAIARKDMPLRADEIEKYIKKWMPYYRIPGNWDNWEFEQKLQRSKNLEKCQLGSNVTYDIKEWEEYYQDVERLVRNCRVTDFGLCDHDEWKKFFSYKLEQTSSEAEEEEVVSDETESGDVTVAFEDEEGEPMASPGHSAEVIEVDDDEEDEPLPSPSRSPIQADDIIVIDSDDDDDELPAISPSERPLAIRVEQEVITLDDDSPVGSPRSDESDEVQIVGEYYPPPDDRPEFDDGRFGCFYVNPSGYGQEEPEEVDLQQDEDGLYDEGPGNQRQMVYLDDEEPEDEDVDVEAIDDEEPNYHEPDSEDLGHQELEDDVVEYEEPDEVGPSTSAQSSSFWRALEKIVDHDEPPRQSRRLASRRETLEDTGQKRRLEDTDDTDSPRKKLAGLSLSEEGGSHDASPEEQDAEHESDNEVEADEEGVNGEGPAQITSISSTEETSEEVVIATIHNCPLPLHVYVGLAILNGSNKKTAITSTIMRFLGHFSPHFKKRDKNFSQDLKAAFDGNDFIIVSQKKSKKDSAKITEAVVYKFKPKKVEEFKNELGRFDHLSAEELGVANKEIWEKAKKGNMKMKNSKQRVKKKDRATHFLQQARNEYCDFLLQQLLNARDIVMENYREAADTFATCAFCQKHRCSIICEEYKYFEDRKKRCKELERCPRCHQRPLKNHPKDCIVGYCDFCQASGHLPEMCPQNRRPVAPPVNSSNS